MRYSFRDDYSEGAHPAILKRLQETNTIQALGYGYDPWSKQARELLKSIIKQPQAAVHFLCGGTQTNLVAISAFLRPYEAVIATQLSHIAVHETGAIEYTGHRIIEVPTRDGKLTPAQIEKVVAVHRDEHSVRPRLVFISQATELGTVYTLEELAALRRCCDALGLLLYIDGARLSNALGATQQTLAQIARYADAFYLGGTKNGALLGEALVIVNSALQPYFRYHLKQKGALLAKGRVLGIQFLVLLENDLYLHLARHANKMAQRLAEALKQKGFNFLVPPQTNQLFVWLPKEVVQKVRSVFDFHVWIEEKERCCVRLVTSWATTKEMVEAFLALLP